MVILVVKSWEDLFTWRSLGAMKKSDKVLLSSQSGSFRLAGDTPCPEQLFSFGNVCECWRGDELLAELAAPQMENPQCLRWRSTLMEAWEGCCHSHCWGVRGLLSFRSLERWRCMSVSLGFLASLSSLMVDSRRLQLLPMHALGLCSLSNVWSILLFGTGEEARFVSYLGIFKLKDSFFRQF